ncbi:MAG: hypothetical protein M3329_07320 [Pseudomonadota bacterium]|nr:hypothetical protein [Pseudomonadota bacterium]
MMKGSTASLLVVDDLDQPQSHRRHFRKQLDQVGLAAIRSEDRKIQQDRLEACLCKPDMVHRWELSKVYKDGRPLCVRDSAGAMTGLTSHASVLVICENIFEAHLLS